MTRDTHSGMTRREFVTHLAVAFVSVRFRKRRKPPAPPAWVAPGWADPLLFA